MLVVLRGNLLHVCNWSKLLAIKLLTNVLCPYNDLQVLLVQLSSLVQYLRKAVSQWQQG